MRTNNEILSQLNVSELSLLVAEIDTRYNV